MKWRRIAQLGMASSLMIASAIACAGGSTQLGFKTSLNAAADTLRVSSMIVTELYNGSTAAKAGLRVGDEILELNGHTVRGALIQDLWREKQSIRPKDTVRLQIRHADGITETIAFPASRAVVA
jgi:C-terminal processing protease CtpA/Prc